MSVRYVYLYVVCIVYVQTSWQIALLHEKLPVKCLCAWEIIECGYGNKSSYCQTVECAIVCTYVHTVIVLLRIIGFVFM